MSQEDKDKRDAVINFNKKYSWSKSKMLPAVLEQVTNSTKLKEGQEKIKEIMRNVDITKKLK